MIISQTQQAMLSQTNHRIRAFLHPNRIQNKLISLVYLIAEKNKNKQINANEKSESGLEGLDGRPQKRRGPPPVHALHVHSPLPPAPLALGRVHSGELMFHSLGGEEVDMEC